MLVDGSQGAVHMPVDVQAMGCDFYAITGHKSQGSQYESGIALEEPIARTEEDRRRWLYTVYTRFAKRVIGAA